MFSSVLGSRSELLFNMFQSQKQQVLKQVNNGNVSALHSD